jgi:Ca2+-transporting ATPase
MKYLGHTTKEVEEILKKEGLNSIEEKRSFPVLKAVISSIKEPMMVILLIACLVYFFIGQFNDFLILTISAFIILSINLFQNYKAEVSILKLKSLSQKMTEVIRDGEKKIIPSELLVRGDIVLINEGERIPADILILESSNFSVDESILTGESLPINKEQNKYHSDSLKNKKINESHQVFAGTVAISGWMIGSVIETGPHTKFGCTNES